MATATFEYYQANRERFLEGLTSLLKIPSISTLPEHKSDVRRAAEFVSSELRSMGMRGVEIIDGKEGQNPLVYGEWLELASRPTLLLYGHYDVQPPDPLDEWISPPFEPAVRNQNIYARGAVDDKGQTYLLLKAVEGFMKTGGRLPINVKFLIEGEEEVGGEHIEQYVPKHREKLKADAALICDTEMFAPGLPTITTGLRGLVYTELEAQGAAAWAGKKAFWGPGRFGGGPTLEGPATRGGSGGGGAKGVPPAVATAKISMRWVPDMAPKEVPRQYTAYVKKLTPRGVTTKVRVISSAPASVVSTENRYIEAAAEAMEQVFKKKTVYMRSGGSIPIAGLFYDHLDVPVVMMGFGLPDDNLHAPNEKFHLPNFYGGIEAVGRYLELLGR